MRSAKLARILLCTLVSSGLAIVVASSAASASPFEGLRVHRQWVMGTMLTIAIEVPRGKSAERLLQGAFARVTLWDRLLSNFKPSSELSRLNRQAGKSWLTVDRRVVDYLRRAKLDARRTHGAFDVTIGPLSALKRIPMPSESQRREVLSRVGSKWIELAPPDKVRLARAGMKLDPGGNGKGVALDSVVAFLRANGVRRAFIDFGGSSFFGIGTPKGRKGWPVLLTDAKKKPWRVIWLVDQGLSMSHSAQELSPGRVRYHIVDPRTGVHVKRWRAAAVVSSTATDGEVLSTALVVDPSLRAVLRRAYPGSAAILFLPSGTMIDQALRSRLSATR